MSKLLELANHWINAELGEPTMPTEEAMSLSPRYMREIGKELKDLIETVEDLKNKIELLNKTEE